MPELFRMFGLRFYFWSHDHEPIHIHVENADGEAKIQVDPVRLIKNQNIKDKDLHLAKSIIEENKDLIIEKWNTFFKK